MKFKMLLQKPNPIRVGFTTPQFELITTDYQFPAMVAGFGAGKTEALIGRTIDKKLQYPMCNVAYYMPTFDLIRRVAYDRIEEKFTAYNVPYKLNRSLAKFDVENCGEIIFRTMDRPARIIAYEVADSMVDELDTLKIDDARTVWQKVISRNRQKKPDGKKNTIAVGTTPEGFRFTYETWDEIKNPGGLAKGYKLIRASTYSNAHNLPDGYIQSLLDIYPSSLIAAYLEGQFINLTSGSCYPQFNRIENASNDTIIQGEYLHVGMDFNVGKMAAIVFVIRTIKLGNIVAEYPVAIAEVIGVLDTPAMINALRLRFPNHPIGIYPDASGASRKSNNASVSDISLLQSAGFAVMANASNPAVKDRLLSMNVLIAKRTFKINIQQCPQFTEALEKQAFDKKGEPDKTSGHDHANDAGGYFICYRYPIVKPSSQRLELAGV